MLLCAVVLLVEQAFFSSNLWRREEKAGKISDAVADTHSTSGLHASDLL